ncbi:MAG: hypothetical protein Unbinned5434contig1000_41 [Prokaryotic dsDNA virus sp.]|jgi:hypothetical protein|nr:MAG: hypothetical protein Unbinned5434contig1000_41 [Prokaryotic dsDNA virus sp.]|tara:strand:+ start:682 stop:879 length:198 start_codon:yes stop_codon:yes gene_type:complete
MFENHFKAEMKRLNLKRYDVCFLLDCTMPTLKSRLKNPETFTIGEVMILQNSDFNLSQFELIIND